MSDSLTVNADLSQRSSIQKDSLRVWWTLFRKEFRETGFYGITIMLGGLLVIALGCFGSGFANSRHEAVNYLNGLFLLAKAFPLLIVLSCGAVLFSIEHGNRSYQLLRSLPIPPLMLFWIKLSLLILLTLASCIVFWPIAYAFNYYEQSIGKEFLASLPEYSINMVEAMLWALFFSLREKKVIHAIIKSGISYFVVANGLAGISLIDTTNRDFDQYFFWGIVFARMAIAFTLFMLVVRLATRWLSDEAAVASGSRVVRRAIEFDSSTALASWKRLIWLQFRANWLPLLVLGLANLSIVLITSAIWDPFSNMQPLAPEVGMFFWCISVAMLCVVAGNSPGEHTRLLLAAGFSPRKIWLAFSLPLFGFCTVSALLFFLTIPINTRGDHVFAWFYFYHLLIAIGVGQFASLVCRNLITGLVLSGILTVLVYFVFSFSRAAYVHQAPAVIAFAGIPLLLAFYFSYAKATTGKLGGKFWCIAPASVCLVLIPSLPLLRVYEVPDADVSAILADYEAPVEFTPKQLAELRQYGDELIEIDEVVREASPTYFEANEELFVNVIGPQMELEQVERILLASSKDDIKDLKRLNMIRSVFAMRSNRITRQVQSGEARQKEVNQLIRQAYTYVNLSVIYYWMSHPDTSSEDIQALIHKLEDEEKIFEFNRAYSMAIYRMCMATVDSRPEEFPRIFDAGYLSGNLLLNMPWEVARFKRNSRARLAEHWRMIHELESYHRENDFGFSKVTKTPEIRLDLIVMSMEGIRTPRPYYYLDHYLFDIRAQRLYLALVLWHREHGEMPNDLSELEGTYLKKLPVSPFDGEPFYLARNGFTEMQFQSSPHLEEVQRQWEGVRPFNVRTDFPAPGQPILWINKYQRPRPDLELPKPERKIRSVSDFDDDSCFSSLAFWILPKNSQTGSDQQ